MSATRIGIAVVIVIIAAVIVGRARRGGRIRSRGRPCPAAERQALELADKVGSSLEQLCESGRACALEAEKVGLGRCVAAIVGAADSARATFKGHRLTVPDAHALLRGLGHGPSGAVSPLESLIAARSADGSELRSFGRRLAELTRVRVAGSAMFRAG